MTLMRFPNRMPAPRSLFEDLPDRLRQMFEGGLAIEPFTEPIGWMPAMEIIDRNGALVVTAELPGVKEKDVEVSIEEGVLTIKGEKKEEKEEGKPEGRYHMWERRYGSFHRAFTLPREVDAEKIAAQFDNGVLTVTLPKTEKAKLHGKKIPIKGSK